jgi:hypothetical protein
MSQTIEIETVVQPDGRIEIRVPGLKPGQRAKVVITTDGEDERTKNPLDVLASMPGHLQFQTAEEVEAYIREERDSWDR